MGSKSSPAPPPNFQPIAQAQMQSAQLANQTAQQQLDWAKQAWAADQSRAAGQQATLDQLVADARERQGKLDAQAAADRARYEAVFQPLEDSLVRESQQYTPELIAGRAEAAAGRASADVASQFAVARSAAQDRLESFGIDPSQVRAGALDLAGRTAQAAASAGAANMQRDATTAREQQYGAQLRSQALALGQGYPGQALSAYAAGLGNQQAAAGLGQQGLGNFLASNQLGGQLMGSPTQWGGLGNAGLAGASDTLASGYKNYLDYYKQKQSQSSGWGTALGLAGGIGLSAVMPTAQVALAPKIASLFAEGGAVPGDDAPHSGVPVTEDMAPPGAPPVDGVPAALNVGEFIIPKDIVGWKGEEFFQKLIQKSREAKQEAPAKPRMAAVPMGPPTLSTVPQPPPPSPTALPLG